MKLSEALKQTIRTIPDFPKPGIMFRDITTILQTPEVFRACVQDMEQQVRAVGADVIVGIESRGFLFGAPIAVDLGLPMVLARKPGKLPYKTRSVEYELEYGTDRVEMHTDSFEPGARVVVVDDLLATGGTAGAVAKLVRELGGQVVGLLFVVELPALGGRARLSDYTVYTQVEFEGD